MSHATPPAPSAPDGAPDRPATLRGPWLVAATLSLFLIVPPIVYAAFRLVNADLRGARQQQPLAWSQRAHWPEFDVRYKSLERGMMSQARAGQTYKDYGFSVPLALEASIARCRGLVDDPALPFASPTVRDALEHEARAAPDNFYAPALLALWHQANGAADAADDAWAAAFAAAPAALIQHVTDHDGRPLTGHDVGTVGFAFDRVVADRLDPSLTLVYPRVATDRTGTWRLPAFKTILRVYDPALDPAGPNDPYGQPALTFVGRVGRLPNAAASTGP